MSRKTFVQNTMLVRLKQIDSLGNVSVVQEFGAHPNMFVVPTVGSHMTFAVKDFSFNATLRKGEGADSEPVTDVTVGKVLNVDYRYSLKLQENGASLNQGIDILLDMQL